MPVTDTLGKFSRRERQIMDALFKGGKATAAEIQAAIPGGPGYSAIRAFLRILEEKGHVRHEEQDGRYVYQPVASKDSVRKGAMRHLADTFFQGSMERAAAAFIDMSAAKLTDSDLDRLKFQIDRARKDKS